MDNINPGVSAPDIKNTPEGHDENAPLRDLPEGAKVTRFAPSPTGYMHVGNLRTALYTYLTAKHDDGVFILRIEDTDQGRKVEGAVDVIYKTLTETGLLWDEGPDKPGKVGPYVQSERMGIFKAWAEKLVADGKAYYCFCTQDRLETLRKKLPGSDEEIMHYDKHCLSLSKEEVAEALAPQSTVITKDKISAVLKTDSEDVVSLDFYNNESAVLTNGKYEIRYDASKLRYNGISTDVDYKAINNSNEGKIIFTFAEKTGEASGSKVFTVNFIRLNDKSSDVYIDEKENGRRVAISDVSYEYHIPKKGDGLPDRDPKRKTSTSYKIPVTGIDW